MGIRNLIGDGLGFGGPQWLTTLGYGSLGGTVPAVVPSPTRLAVLTQTATLLVPIDGVGGPPMAVPLIVTEDETSDITFALVGGDQTRQNLADSTVTLRVVNLIGTVVVNAVALTVSDEDEGEVTWDRLTAQVTEPGDYRYQVKVVQDDGTVIYFPDSDPNIGNPMSILRAL